MSGTEQAKAAPDFSSLVYGSLVTTLLELVESVDDVNARLDTIGYRVGRHLAHSFARDKKLNRAEMTSDSSVYNIINNIFIRHWPSFSGSSSPPHPRQMGDSEYLIVFPHSVYTRNVTVPESFSSLQYASILPGIIRGIFEIFHYEVKVSLSHTTANSGGTEVWIHDVKPIPIAIPKDTD
jgi:hypothetical protein